jgi:hypothetical protein
MRFAASSGGFYGPTDWGSHIGALATDFWHVRVGIVLKGWKTGKTIPQVKEDLAAEAKKQRLKPLDEDDVKRGLLDLKWFLGLHLSPALPGGGVLLFYYPGCIIDESRWDGMMIGLHSGGFELHEHACEETFLHSTIDEDEDEDIRSMRKWQQLVHEVENSGPDQCIEHPYASKYRRESEPEPATEEKQEEPKKPYVSEVRQRNKREYSRVRGETRGRKRSMKNKKKLRRLAGFAAGKESYK